MLNAQIEETFTGHALVKAFGRQREVEQRFRETNDELYESSFGAQFMSSLMQPCTMFMGNLQYVIVAVVGGLRVASGAITIGDIQAFIQYSRQFSMPLTQLASMMNVFQSGIASFERVFEFLDAEEQSPDAGRRRDDPPPVRGPGRVPRRHVLLRPRPAAHRVAVARRRARPDHRHRRARPARARPRSSTSSCGSTSSNGGVITLDGRDISSIPRAELRSKIGMVLQDTWLFGGTHPRQHRLRQPRRDRGADPRGGAGHLRRPLRALAARRLRHDDQRRGRQRQRGPEAAAHHRPRLPRRPRRSSSSTRPPARSTPAPRC